MVASPAWGGVVVLGGLGRVDGAQGLVSGAVWSESGMTIGLSQTVRKSKKMVRDDAILLDNQPHKNK
jgi:hypothetical protein